MNNKKHKHKFIYAPEGKLMNFCEKICETCGLGVFPVELQREFTKLKEMKRFLKKYHPEFIIRWMPNKIIITEKEIKKWKKEELEFAKIINVIFTKNFSETWEKLKNV